MPQVPGIFEACQDPGRVGATVFMEQGVRGARIGPQYRLSRGFGNHGPGRWRRQSFVQLPEPAHVQLFLRCPGAFLEVRPGSCRLGA